MKLHTLLICILSSIVTFGNTFYVTNTNTSGAGSLDQAIKDVNTYPSSPTAPHLIDFSGLSGANTLTLTSALDPISNPTKIDGTTIGSYSGSALFTIDAVGYTVSTNNGKVLEFRSNATGSSVYAIDILGTDAVGAKDKYGIYIDDADNIIIDNCSFAYCDRGIFMDNSRETIVTNCLIENYLTWGIGIWNDAYNTTISHNEIRNGNSVPIYLSGSNATITENEIHDASEKGITVIHEIDHGLGQNNTITKNTIYNFAIGVEVYGTNQVSNIAANYNLISENIFYNIGSRQIFLWTSSGYPGNDSYAKPNITTAESSGLIEGDGVEANSVVELFTANSSTDALVFLGSTVADAIGNWTYNHQTSITTTGVTALAIDPTTNNTSEMDYLAITEVDVEIEDTCTNCVGSFTLVPGEKYLITAWVHEEDENFNLTTFANGKIYLDFDDGTSITTLGAFVGEGQIIDGWQRIEAEFTVPANAISMSVRLQSASGDVFFDDIRILPFDGSMKSYVYDPVFMRLMAEMDERHYATFYEYDEEGKLIRIKKETEKGIMTIQETRNNNSK